PVRVEPAEPEDGHEYRHDPEGAQTHRPQYQRPREQEHRERVEDDEHQCHQIEADGKLHPRRSDRLSAALVVHQLDGAGPARPGASTGALARAPTRNGAMNAAKRSTRLEPDNFALLQIDPGRQYSTRPAGPRAPPWAFAGSERVSIGAALADASYRRASASTASAAASASESGPCRTSAR